MRARRSILAAAAAGVLLLLAGCNDKASEPYKDAPRAKTVNRDPATVVEMPDGFSNVSTKCDHGNRVYTAFHGDSKYGSIAVVAHDPTCGA